MVTNEIQQELEQRNYISTSEKKNIFIEAGAGAGKSTSLVDRTYYSLAETVEARRIRESISSGQKTKEDILRELNDFNGCTDKEIAFRKKLIDEIDDIIAGNIVEIIAKDIYAITFTNKATEELRVRIVKKLQDEDKCTPEEIWRKKQILKDIDNIHISTIHKFCEDILKENAVKAGLSPNFVPIIDEEEQEVVNRVVRNYFRHFKHWSTFEKYESIGVDRKDVKEAIAGSGGVLRSLLSTADRIEKDQIYRCDSFKGDGFADYETAITNLLDELDSFLENNPNKKGHLLSVKTILNSRGYAYDQTKTERMDAIKKIMSTEDKEWYDEFKDGKVPLISRAPADLKDEIIETFEPLIHEVVQRRYNVFIGLARLYIDYGYELYEAYLKDRDNNV